MATQQIRGNTQIMPATITNAEISASAAIALSKLATTVIQANGGQAFTADQSMGNFKLTNLAAPVGASDAARKADVDAASNGLDLKASVRVSTAVAGTLATSFQNASIVDGVTLATGDRILIKDQVAGAENGIYTVNASGTPTRATDADSNTEVTGGMFTFIEEGTINADTGWVLTNNGAITLGTTALTFTQFSGAGSLTAGAGLTKTGNSIDVIGTANRIVVTADQVDIGTDVVTLTGTQTLTNKTLTAPAINSPTGIVKADVGLGNVDNTSNVTERAATATLTNKTIALGSNTVSGTMAQFDTAVTDSNFVYMASVVIRETPTGAVNGANTSFALATTPITGTEEVFLNGLMQDPGAGNDYTIAGATITMLAAPLTNDKIRVNYYK